MIQPLQPSSSRDADLQALRVTSHIKLNAAKNPVDDNIANELFNVVHHTRHTNESISLHDIANGTHLADKLKQHDSRIHNLRRVNQHGIRGR